MIGAGIDAGSRTIKVVLCDHAHAKVLGSGIANQGIEQSRLAGEPYDRTLPEAGLTRAQVPAVVATGYGRNRLPFAGSTITEIRCHARGVHHLVPAARTIIEISGQDSKVILLAT
jgi:activator of 2-hydroxyglutaryl-CoA dehydratase